MEALLEIATIIHIGFMKKLRWGKFKLLPQGPTAS